VRAPGPPLTFLISVVTLWIGGRAAMLAWQEDGPVPMAAKDAPALARAVPAALPPAPAVPTPAGIAAAKSDGVIPKRRQSAGIGLASAMLSGLSRERYAAPIFPVERPFSGTTAAVSGAAPPPIFPAEPTRSPAPAQAGDRRWSASLFLFARDGGGAVPLAGGGQLGASQAGARIAYRIDDAGHVAAAARVYAPIDSPRGSEAAAGIDLHPLPGAPLRLSIERRIALGKQGRDAWSAYAAGGFFRGIGRSIELDGYAQAGVVGVHARDLFADGALRAARRFDLGGGRAVLAGGGAWAAAQPGAERVDAGPRIALRLPAGAAAISIAGEWRARLAGSARPRSGPALTIAADF
jgi:hypothetical protein